MSEAASKRYRVVQWATGNVGARALRRAIEHPQLDVVGVWVHGAAKVGRDAGELAGLAPIGVKATDSIDEVIALEPDCVLYMPHHNVVDDVCRLLEAGINIVSTRMEYQNPRALDPALADRLEEACRRGDSSIHATGSSPGFITEAVPIALLSIERRLDCLTIYEFADTSSRNSPEMIFDMMGFGREPGKMNAGMLEHFRTSFGPSLSLLADAIGLPLEEIRVDGAVGTARTDLHIAAGTVSAGTVAATRVRLEGLRGGRPLMRMIANWYVGSDVDTGDGEEWLFRESGWRVSLEGDCPMDINIVFPVAPEDYAEMTPGLTAHRPVNMVPYVCEAPAGIRTTVTLPQCIARLG